MSKTVIILNFMFLSNLISFSMYALSLASDKAKESVLIPLTIINVLFCFMVEIRMLFRKFTKMSSASLSSSI